jgi:hypothetical protein
VVPVRVVVRYTNGQALKGLLEDFAPDKETFNLNLVGNGVKAPATIFLKDLKALFFVREFTGDPRYHERKVCPEGARTEGQKVEITFLDGEVLVGTAPSCDTDRPGFFIYPADPSSNNTKLFVVSGAVRNIRYL